MPWCDARVPFRREGRSIMVVLTQTYGLKTVGKPKGTHRPPVIRITGHMGGMHLL